MATVDEIIRYLEQRPEMDPDQHDASYQLVRKAIELYKEADFKTFDVKDVELVYFLTVGTFSEGYPDKEKRIRNSHLSDEGKTALIAFLHELRQKAAQHEFSTHLKGDDIGMFGTGFHSMANKAGIPSEMQRMLKMLIEIASTNDEEEMFALADEFLKNPVGGVGPAVFSQILHCLNPMNFPIMNSRGFESFKKLGIKLQKTENIHFLMNNVRIIRDFRNQHFKFKNYRLLDSEVWDILSPPPTLPLPKPPVHPNGTGGEDQVNKQQLNQLNLILYGPPGTGKTYSVVDESLRVIDENQYKGLIGNIAKRQEAQAEFKRLCEQKRIAFCTFHQSFGYEEFVEGLRSDSGGNFIPKNGVFKDLCEAAKSSITMPAAQYEFSDAANYYKMSLGNVQATEDQEIYQYCIENNVIALGWGGNADYAPCKNLDQIRALYEKTNPGASKFGVDAILRFKDWMKMGDAVLISSGNSRVRAIARITGEYQYRNDSPLSSNYSHFRQVEWLLQDVSIPVEQILKKKLSQQTIYQFYKQDLLMDTLRRYLHKDKGDYSTENYVLVIDEINRGNISKIFGELITLIEPDKRLGAENELRVTLPYSQDVFGVPKNLYIIGTMNTADRSIALMDTALRRRFCFRELMTQYGLLAASVEGVNLQQLVRTMNDRIEYLFDRDHTLGHSFFMGVKSVAELITVMKDKIIPLLQEYFYEDWEKIALVLGGAGKKGANYEASYFLVKSSLDPKHLFPVAKEYQNNDKHDCYFVVEKPEKEALHRIYEKVEAAVE